MIAPGDILRKINGNKISDVLDYKFHTYDARLMLELTGAKGKLKLVRLRKTEGADIGLEFETFLMDRERSCANKCIFCFIDQLPKGMRKTLYYKDDDVRLSFFQGNYVTLTNLSARDIERIIKLRVSPINVSVHTLDPQLRTYMLGTKRAAEGIDALKMLAGAGITLNCQIVCCPGINDGQELRRTLEGLYALGPYINSVSVVPVGLTKHREELAALRPFDRELALQTIGRVDSIGEKCLKKRGSRVFYCADELYIKAGPQLPPSAYYEEYPQLENGVGMMRLFITEFYDELRKSFPSDLRLKSDFTEEAATNPAATEQAATKPAATEEAATNPAATKPASTEEAADHRDPRIPKLGFSIVTGTAAGKYLTKLLKSISKKYDILTGVCSTVGRVYPIRNDFFGDSVTVAGLVTGGDIIAQLKGCELGSKLLIPQNMLRHGGDVFLDDVKVTDVEEALGVPALVVRQNGADFLHAILTQYKQSDAQSNM